MDIIVNKLALWLRRRERAKIRKTAPISEDCLIVGEVFANGEKVFDYKDGKPPTKALARSLEAFSSEISFVMIDGDSYSSENIVSCKIQPSIISIFPSKSAERLCMPAFSKP